MFVKVCGITRLDDAVHAAEQGATALGFVFWPKSPRFVTPDRAGEIIVRLPPHVTTVGVFVNESLDGICDAARRSGISAVQLHGDESPELADALGWPVLRSVTLTEASAVCATWPGHTTLLLDAADKVRRGGTGITIDWAEAAAVAQQRRTILAGGLTPDNVREAIAAVRPFGVDVSSGVEERPGQKNRDKVRRFLTHAREAFEWR